MRQTDARCSDFSNEGEILGSISGVAGSALLLFIRRKTEGGLFLGKLCQLLQSEKDEGRKEGRG